MLIDNTTQFLTPLDKHYLSLQFWHKVYQKNAIEYQAFFEGIMEKAFTGFQKIRPYGNSGDKGNDGYRPAEGIYYQVYAPAEPGEKEATAAEKFKEDFEKLKNGWDKISTIKELNFVYNDKGSGLTIKLEEARAELKAVNPGIEFEIFTSRKLEQIFFTLSVDQILSLGFDVDLRKAIQSARDYLEKLDAELDKESGEFVLRALGNIKEVVAGQKDESLLLDYQILEARALLKNEAVNEARERFESIFKRYPQDPRAPLHLAEIYLNNEDYEKNSDFLAKAERIAPDYWLLRLEKLIREIRLESKFDPAGIDERTFPDEPRARANFYRIYSALLERAGDGKRAESFIERAIHFNPDRFANYDVRLSVMEDKIFAVQDREKRRTVADALLVEIEAVEKQFREFGGLGPRSQSLLNVKKLYAYVANEDFPSLEKMAKETFALILDCYFDEIIEKLLVQLTHLVELPNADFLKLQNYLWQAEKPLSDTLARVLVLQFTRKDTLFTNGKAFFAEMGKQNTTDFIAALEKGDHVKVINLAKSDVPFAVDFALSLKEPAELRRKIVESLPDDGSIQKEKLFLILYHDEGNLDKAFEILQQMDLSKLSFVECLPTLKVAQEKEAWDSVIVLLEKLLKYEKDRAFALQIKLQLFTANFKLERYPEAIRVGISVLEDADDVKMLNEHDREALVVQTAQSYLKRGDPAAKEFIEKHAASLKSCEAKLSTETEVYLRNGDGKNALRTVVEAVKLLRHPSPEQYGMLFLISAKIGNLLHDFKLTSSEQVGPGSFVKLKEQERWFYLGDGEELDATKIPETDGCYSFFMDKKLGDKIDFVDKYRSVHPEYTLEIILPIEKYILWQATHCAQKLSAEHRWDAMEMIEVPITEGSVDVKYLVARLEDEANKRGSFFNLYCEQNVPFALLALNEGGLTNAIGRITNEGRGFIRASAGSMDELKQQKDAAKGMVDGKAFYLDGTSTLMLSETGQLAKIYEFLPSLKVPQAVITLLLELRDKFEYSPGQVGHMGYANGKITYSRIDRKQRDAIKSNFETSVNVLESHPERIGVISSANKSSAFSEQKVAPSLADACILAQKEGIAVVTEDFLYLKANEYETKKPAPPYCSSLALLRVLYEQEKVSFEEYLDYFAYLSSYRVRFLAITTEDLEKAVFGDQIITIFRPEQLRKFNFALTLSEEYGVDPRVAFQLVGRFIVKVLLDDSILPEMAQRIFYEIVSLFPTKWDRKAFGRVLLVVAGKTIDKIRKTLIVGSRLKEKIDAIAAFLEFYSPDGVIILK
jgi:tetratricopeptide (TPR) repeat protein